MLDPASGTLTGLDVDSALLEEAVLLLGSLSAPLSDPVSDFVFLEPSPVLERTLSAPLLSEPLMDCVPPEPSRVLGRSLSEYHC